MVKRYFYERDFLQENKKADHTECLYCGSVLLREHDEYCSEFCKKKDSVWRCEDSAV